MASSSSFLSSFSLCLCLCIGTCLCPAQEEPRPDAAGLPAAREDVDRDALQNAKLRHLPNGDVTIGTLHLHKDARQISFPAAFLPGISVVEAIIITPTGRRHEALLEADVSPLQFQFMLYLLGLENGPRLADKQGRQGARVDIDVEWQKPDGTVVRAPVETWIVDTRTGLGMARAGWVFTGSAIRDRRFLAEVEGNICINYSVGSTILDSPDPQSQDDTIHILKEGAERPAPGTPVKVIVTPRGKVE